MQDTTHSLTADTKQTRLSFTVSVGSTQTLPSRKRGPVRIRGFWCLLLLALLTGLSLNAPSALADIIVLKQEPPPPAVPIFLETKDTTTGVIETQIFRQENGTVTTYWDEKQDSNGRLIYREVEYFSINNQQTGGVKETWTYNANGSVTHTYQNYNPDTGKWNSVVENVTNIGYQIQDIGFLAGGSFTQVEGLNKNGEVAGYALDATNTSHAFFWQNGQMNVLGTLGGPSAAAFAINNSGQVAGEAATSVLDSSGNTIYHACLWQNGEPIDLGTLGGEYSEAYGINNNGQIVGWAETASSDMHAALWQNGQIFDLGVLPGGTEGSYATAINDTGQVVGTSSTESGQFDAFFWQNNAMTDIAQLPFITTGSSALAINDAGEVTGRCSIYWTNNTTDFTWNATVGFHFFGGLGGDSAALSSINNLGLRVGSSLPSDNSTEFHAWRYDNKYQDRDLNDTIPLNSGWMLTAADAVNDKGWIAGEGIVQGDSKLHAYLLTPLSIKALSLPATMPIGSTATCTVQLSGPAPKVGAVIQLSSSNKAALSVPSRLTIPSGATSGTFVATAGAVSSLITVKVKVTYDSTTKSTATVIVP